MSDEQFVAFSDSRLLAPASQGITEVEKKILEDEGKRRGLNIYSDDPLGDKNAPNAPDDGPTAPTSR